MSSNVYWMNARSDSQATGLSAQMLAVFEAAGLGKFIKPNDVVAIKLHCGEWGNTAYLRPLYARALADHIKENYGGRPFVCDTTTLPYSPYSSRVTAQDLMQTAERNGLTSAALGCPFIVADGWHGKADVRVDLPEGYLLKEAFIAEAIANAGALIALTHFKGHALGVFGGSIKNLGIGAQSKRGKHNVHMGGHPRYGLGTATDFHPEKCLGTACPSSDICQNGCAWDLIHVHENGVEWEREKCTSCLAHLATSVNCGVFDYPPANFEATSVGIADACLGAIKAVGKDKVGFINMAIDISPACDCAGYADVPLVPPVGVFASTDPVAIDTATKDKVTESQGMPRSVCEEVGIMAAGQKKFELGASLIGCSEEIQLNVGQVIGMGTRDYKLVDVPAPTDPRLFRFKYDLRPNKQRFSKLFSENDPFPYERYEGKGFDRKDEVDIEAVR